MKQVRPLDACGRLDLVHPRFEQVGRDRLREGARAGRKFAQHGARGVRLKNRAILRIGAGLIAVEANHGRGRGGELIEVVDFWHKYYQQLLKPFFYWYWSRVVTR